MEAVIFDVDGVLTDSEPLHLDAANRVLESFNARLSEEENQALLGLDEKTFWQKMIERFQLAEEPKALADRRVLEVLRLIREGILPLPGVPEFITGLIMRGLLLATASSSPRVVVEAILEELGIERTFRSVICGDDVEEGKPAPHIFLKAAAALDVPPEECMVIEDSPNGILAARRAGMFVVAVENQYNRGLDLRAADRVFSGLNRFDWSLFDER